MEQNQRLSDSIEFPLIEFDKAIIDIVPFMPAPPQWAAFNALRHLDKAWRLRATDTEMSMFRAITAEEEVATALFLSLKRRHYVGANRLKHRDHVHKNAVIPFVD